MTAALLYGRTRAAPDLVTPALEMFGETATVTPVAGALRVTDESGVVVGWVGSGSASGYGGPMLVAVGIDTSGAVVGARVVEQRETPIFWRLARAATYCGAIAGSPYRLVNYDYQDVVGMTGATITADAIVASVRAAVADAAHAAFDDDLPLPPSSFEFGALEVTILVLFAVAIVAQRAGGPLRRRARWAAQIAGLLVLGFWKDSPITLSKLAALAAGYLPDPRGNLALYGLTIGFLVTSLLYGRNLYCLYVCPFGAAQRCVGLIGGTPLKLPQWSVRAMAAARNVVVFAAIVVAFLTLKPVVAAYEPFAVLFSLRGTTLQWLLLFLVMVISLVVSTPWCNFLCPMRTVELAIHDVSATWRPRRRRSND